MKVEGDKREVVKERAGTEEISDQEREKRRNRNERKMEKEGVKEVRTTPNDSGDDMWFQTPTVSDWLHGGEGSPRRLLRSSQAKEPLQV